jgi:hypothetical protein
MPRSSWAKDARHLAHRGPHRVVWVVPRRRTRFGTRTRLGLQARTFRLGAAARLGHADGCALSSSDVCTRWSGRSRCVLGARTASRAAGGGGTSAAKYLPARVLGRPNGRVLRTALLAALGTPTRRRWFVPRDRVSASRIPCLRAREGIRRLISRRMGRQRPQKRQGRSSRGTARASHTPWSWTPIAFGAAGGTGRPGVSTLPSTLAPSSAPPSRAGAWRSSARPSRPTRRRAAWSWSPRARAERGRYPLAQGVSAGRSRPCRASSRIRLRGRALLGQERASGNRLPRLFNAAPGRARQAVPPLTRGRARKPSLNPHLRFGCSTSLTLSGSGFKPCSRACAGARGRVHSSPEGPSSSISSVRSARVPTAPTFPILALPPSGGCDFDAATRSEGRSRRGGEPIEPGPMQEWRYKWRRPECSPDRLPSAIRSVAAKARCKERERRDSNPRPPA